MTKKDQLLSSLRNSSDLNGSILKPEMVNAMGAILGISSQDMLNYIDQWQKDKVVSVQWGGTLELMPQQKEAGGNNFAGAQISAPIAIGANSTAGHGARGAGSIHIESKENIDIGALVAALAQLKAMVSDVPDTHRQLADNLAEDVAAVVQEINTTSPDKTKLESAAGRIGGLVESLGKIAENTPKLLPILGLLRDKIALFL